MNINERIEAFWSGQKPDKIPYTIMKFFWHVVKDDPVWTNMYKQGLGITWNILSFERIMANTEVKVKQYEEKGKINKTTTYITPVGEIYQNEILDNPLQMGWVQKYLLETPADYKVMTFITDNTKIVPAFEEYNAKMKELPFYAVPEMIMARTPLQSMLIDYAGINNFSFHMFEFEDEVHMLYESLERLFSRTINVVAHGPGRYINVRENFTAESLGPERFLKYHVPIYKKYYPILQSAGKIVGNHYDGRLRSCSKLIADSPIDLIESLTPPNEGDMELDECRKAWPDKLFWSNIKISDYDLSPEKLRERIYELVEKAAPDGRRLAFEVSEDIPHNWRTSMPIVLDALNCLADERGFV